MTGFSFGDISVAEYQRLTRRSRPWPRRLALLGLALVACGSLTAAGDFLGIWTGKRSSTMPTSLAVEVLNAEPSEKWQSDIAMGVVYAEVEKLIEKIGQSATANAANGTYAGAYLRNAALASIRQIKAIAAHDPANKRMTSYLKDIRDESGGE